MSVNNNETTAKNSKSHTGHRAKVRSRYYASGLKGMPDHNVLELLLFFGIPYKDTNVIAHELIDKFGSFSAVLEAAPEDLMSVKGMTENAACLINLILPTYKRYYKDVCARKMSCLTVDEIADYIRNLFLDTSDERVYILLFDTTRTFIGHRVIGEGSAVSCNSDFRKLVRYVLETKASGVVLAHNHPHGITAPSHQDIEVTKEVYKLLSYLDVRLLNHIIVNETSHFSMADSSRFSYIFDGLDKPVTEREGIDEEILRVRKLVEEKQRAKANK